MGTPLLILAAASARLLRKRGELLFFWALGAICLALIYLPFVHLALDRIPVFGVTRQSRLLFELGFAICTSGAIALDAILRGTSDDRAVSPRVVWTLSTVAVLSIWLFWYLFRPVFGALEPPPPVAGWCLYASIVVLAFAALLHSVIVSIGQNRVILAAGVLGLAALELWSASYGTTGFVDPADLVPQTGLTQFLGGDTSAYRAISVGSMPSSRGGSQYRGPVLPEPVYSYAGLQSIEGYDAMEVDAYSREIGAYRESRFSTTGGAVPPQVRRLLDRWNVKYLVTGPGQSISGDGIRLAYDAADGRVYLNEDVWPRAFWVNIADFAAGRIAPGAGQASVVSRQPMENGYVVEALDDGYLCVTETLFPGWKAFVNDIEEPIVPCMGTFRAVRVTAGTHTVRMQYRPSSFRVGASISLLSALAAIALSMLAHRRYRSTTLRPSEVVGSYRGAGHGP